MPFINKKSNKLLSKNIICFRSLQGTDGNNKVLSSLEYYFNISCILLQHATYKNINDTCDTREREKILVFNKIVF